MADEDIIRRRLMIDGDGTGDVRQLTMFNKWCGSDDTSQEREETSKNVEKACVAIEDAKQELEEARQVRRNHQEYDALAKLIKEHLPRSYTADKLTLLNQQLQSQKAKRESLEEKLSLRRKQFHVLTTCLSQLVQMLHGDLTPVHDGDVGKRPVVDLVDSPHVDLASQQEMGTS
ncbi:THO complex subunit 7 homolog [Palaemon carinicauda]|uniref:THO complex subunit 7 homolog n=1 Tax=Palaemon carinicauda TaxID=392227 RepID=UPI0035B58DCD